MNKALSFQDVLLVPQFSKISSRKDVDLSAEFMGEKLTLPVLSAPMDSVTNASLATELHKAGGLACLHRFQDIQSNINEFKSVYTASGRSPIVSVGLNDIERMEALYDAGANKFLLDIAHGAQESVVNFSTTFLKKYKDCHLMIGNFSTFKQIQTTFDSIPKNSTNVSKLWFRLGIGGGSACTTRIKTGCGMPTLASILDCNSLVHVCGDGGFKTSGDIAKGIAAGASVVMLGSMLAGTDESPGDLYASHRDFSNRRILSVKDGLASLEVGNDDSQSLSKHFKAIDTLTLKKKYRGSAAASSYKDQGKEWASAEGEEFLIPYKGSVVNVLADIEASLRSSMTYLGASNLTEFRNNATFVEITNAGMIESGPHGKGK